MTTTLLGPLSATTISIVSWSAFAITILCVIPICVALFLPFNHPDRDHSSPVTWGLWFAVGILGTAGMYFGGADSVSWLQKLALSLGPIAVTVIALKRGEPWVADRFDKWSFRLGAAGLIIYIVILFRDPFAAGWVAVLAAIGVDFIGAVPTWKRGLTTRVPMAEIVTFSLALISVIAVLCILPTPWKPISSIYLSLLALQMVSILVTDFIGRARVQVVPVESGYGG